MDIVKIRELMEKQHMTQKELANKAGISGAHISYLLNGTREPSLHTALAIAKALKVEIQEII